MAAERTVGLPHAELTNMEKRQQQLPPAHRRAVSLS
ncbi:hypothetical protein MMMDOFMJ_2910 [Methylobacterium gnaphalii]|nr:hypothetical protein MMMDOFMJ_2910 [Methylobacterium gnaphalii]